MKPIFDNTYYLNVPASHAQRPEIFPPQASLKGHPIRGMAPLVSRGTNRNSTEDDLRRLAGWAVAADCPLAIDHEDFRDGARFKVGESDQITAEFLQQLAWAKAEGAQTGFYLMPVNRNYWGPVQDTGWDEWRADNDTIIPVAEAVDYFFPSLYTFYPDYGDQAHPQARERWVTYALANIAECVRVGGPDKPLYPFLFHLYTASGPGDRYWTWQPIGDDFWRLQLQTLTEHPDVDGVVVWGWREGTESVRQTWPTQGVPHWLPVTQEFIDMPVDITFTIADAAVPRVVAALKGLFPIPTDDDGNPLFTDNQWAKERTRRWWKEQVFRWEQVDAANTAKAAVTELPDGDVT